MELSVPDLYAELTALLQQIPRGRVTTYGTLAEALGSKSAARWVGEYMLDHPHDDNCPCHRVIRSTGEPGRYIGDEAEKINRISAESIPIQNGRVNFTACGFAAESFASTKPLAQLVEAQRKLARSVELRPFRHLPELVAGVDVSYPDKQWSVAAYVLVETATGKLQWSTTVKRRTTFPYIPGFLTYRELPALLELFEQIDVAGRRADVVFVDGNGILHPRRAGIAACLGVLADIPTIGIGKKLLLGSVDLEAVTPGSPCPITYNDEQLGAAMKAKTDSRPIFVSPGHRMDIDNAVRLTEQLFYGHRLPEPIYWADRISRNPEKATAGN